jgi:hypothetical protein
LAPWSRPPAPRPARAARPPSPRVSCSADRPMTTARLPSSPVSPAWPAAHRSRPPSGVQVARAHTTPTPGASPGSSIASSASITCAPCRPLAPPAPLARSSTTPVDHQTWSGSSAPASRATNRARGPSSSAAPPRCWFEPWRSVASMVPPVAPGSAMAGAVLATATSVSSSPAIAGAPGSRTAPSTVVAACRGPRRASSPASARWSGSRTSGTSAGARVPWSAGAPS